MDGLLDRTQNLSDPTLIVALAVLLVEDGLDLHIRQLWVDHVVVDRLDCVIHLAELTLCNVLRVVLVGRAVGIELLDHRGEGRLD